MRKVPIHNLRQNSGTSSPNNVAFIDTESTWQVEGEKEIHRLRLWCGKWVDRSAMVAGGHSGGEADGDTATELVDWLISISRNKTNTWVYAHNLGFDMVLTALPHLLCSRGWVMTAWSIGDRSPFFRFTYRSRRITIVDSFSWLPVSLETIAKHTSASKVELPQDNASRDSWLERCHNDVDVLAEAILSIMSWWDRNALGNWTITGASTGWNAMRHTLKATDILIDPDPKGRALDRKAIYGGRREVWHTGVMARDLYIEVDLKAAYPTIVGGQLMPVRRGRRFSSLPLGHRALSPGRIGIIADVELQVDTPRYPCRVGERVYYPVGRFSTTLAGPEIWEANARGELLSVGPGTYYGLSDALARWGKWILGVVADDTDATPELVRIMAKAWSRSVIGKFAGRTWSSKVIGGSTHLGWHVEPALDRATGHRAQVVDIGADKWWCVSDCDTDNSFPAVYAWVESWCRVLLGRSIDALGESLIIQCDTDGLIIRSRPQGSRSNVTQPSEGWTHKELAAVSVLCRSISDEIGTCELRVKSYHGKLEVLGPQHLIWADGHKLSGVSRTAERTGDREWSDRLWPKFSWHMGRGITGRYERPQVTYHLDGMPLSRWVLTDGSTVPVRITTDAQGRNAILPFSPDAYCLPGAVLADQQNDLLDSALKRDTLELATLAVETH